jgi:tRNA (cmo5U34)-methyltransferase
MDQATSAIDDIFEGTSRVEEFEFNDEVAAVFDDMVSRSVPFYNEVQRIIVEVAERYLTEAGVMYDVGCSTASTICSLAETAPPSTTFVGIDPSDAMLRKAQEKVNALNSDAKITFIASSIQDVDLAEDVDVITMLYTLQFVRPLDRLEVLTRLYESLRPGGCLLIAEKVLADNMFARRLYIDLYHRHKQASGYSPTEISRKREALENVLIPFTNKENLELLSQAGFTEVEQAFRWYNWAAYIAVKPAG